jgi:methyl-accepting chemotaxis protein
MSHSDLSQRLAFMQLDADAGAALRQLAPLLSGALPGILDDFYTHVREWPQVATLFGERGMEVASRKQAEHWNIILRGDFTTEYVDSVRRIGQVHARIGLEPRWYIAGYAFILTRVIALITAHNHGGAGWSLPGQGRKAAADRLAGAFMRAAMLDMDFAISIYLEEGEVAKRRAVQEIAVSFDASIGGIVDSVASAATQLEHTAKSMSSIAHATTEKAMVVSEAAEQATQNIASVSSATGELDQSVAEIAKQVSQASVIASSAVIKARDAGETMMQLSATAEKIGKVVSLISDIARQTNLLALNATIESARAGEAGRGFVVVAAEVRTLAGKTAKATEEIGQEIAAMQQISRESVAAITGIQSTINEIDEVSAAISAAAEEQAATTRQISRNTGEVSNGARNVTRHISDVRQDAQDTGDAAAQVVAASSELGRQAEYLRTQVDGFLSKIRAA